MIDLHQKLLQYAVEPSYINLYLNFINENSLDKKIKFKSQIHHILPKAYFPEYENSSLNKWNSSILLHKDHLHAHYLLSKIISSKMSVAFFMMCQLKNFKLCYESNATFYQDEYEKSIYESYLNNPSKKSENIHRMKTNNPMFNPETRKKLSMTNLSRNYTVSHTLETRKIISESKIGNKNPMFGNTSASKHLNSQKFKCLYCDVETTKGNIIRWHNDNCKSKSK